MLKSEHALQLFEGILEGNSEHGYWVTSTAFLGELGSKAPNLGKESITVRLRVSGREFNSLQDTHALVMVYALFLDAQRSGRSKELQVAMLEQSRRLLSQLERKGDLEDDAKVVSAAVRAALGASASP